MINYVMLYVYRLKLSSKYFSAGSKTVNPQQGLAATRNKDESGSGSQYRRKRRVPVSSNGGIASIRGNTELVDLINAHPCREDIG
jgi:hypothetical protein